MPSGYKLKYRFKFDLAPRKADCQGVADLVYWQPSNLWARIAALKLLYALGAWHPSYCKRKPPWTYWAP
jgi:hypothetical protein